MNTVLEELANKITVKLHEDVEHTDETIAYAKAVEVYFKDHLRRGKIITEDELKELINNICVNGQVSLFEDNNNGK